MEKLCLRGGGGQLFTHRRHSYWGLCGCGGKCRFPSKPYFVGAIQPSSPSFIKKGRLQMRPSKKPYKEATTLHQRGFGTGSRERGVECGKADAYLGSWHSGEHSNTSPHPTHHRKGKRTVGVWTEKGKGFPKAKRPNSEAHPTRRGNKCNDGSNNTK